MVKRVLILVVILGLRLVVGGWLSGGCVGREVRVSGVFDGIEQKGSKYVVRMNQFRAEFLGYKKVEEGKKVEIVGRCERGVMDFLMGRVWLVEPTLEEIGEGEKREFLIMRGLTELRERVVEFYKGSLPDPEAGLVAGVVIGFREKLSQSFYDDLVKTGTIHVVVASGYNVAIVGMIAFEILVYFLIRKWMTVGAIGLMILYGVLAGGDPPVVRAVVMGSVVFLGRAIGRQSDSWWLLFLASWGMVMVRPELIESISFQLSVAATLGLIGVDPWLRLRAERWKKEGWMKVVMETELIPTVSAQIMTAPLIWWYFGRISWISPLVNVIVLPLVPIIMAFGGVSALLGVVWEPLGRLVAPLVYAVAHLFVVMVRFFGGI